MITANTHIGHSERINYIDSLRCFTIVMVVFGHVNSSIGFGGYESILGNFFLTFRMPMFFFISGFVSYKVFDAWDARFFLDMFTKKARVQLVPMIFFLIALTYFTTGRFPHFWEYGFDRYWFTLVLFEMLIIYFILSYLSNILKKNLLWIMIVFSIFGIFALGVMSRGAVIYRVLCLENFFKYIQFFTLGLFCRMYSPSFFKLVSNDKIKGIVIFSFLWCYFVTIHNTIVQYGLLFHFIRDILVRYLGVITIFSIFASFDNFFSSDNFIARTMRSIGKKTLDIYLLHYFFIPNLLFAYPFFCSNDQLILQFTFVSVISIVIVAVCILVSKCLRSSNVLAYWLLGKS